MGLKYVCDICGKESDPSGDNHLSVPDRPRRYDVSVCSTVNGWAVIWSQRAPKQPADSPEAIPLSGDYLVCSSGCAEQALNRINRAQLEAIFKEIIRKPETKLMSAIFGVWYDDGDLILPGLKDTILGLLDEISDLHCESRSRFAERIKRLISLRVGFADGEAKTLEEVGEEFGVTRERIRQMEAKALRLLRHPARSGKLKPFIRREAHEVKEAGDAAFTTTEKTGEG